MENLDLKELQTEMFEILLYVVEMNLIKIILMSDVLFGVKKHQDFFMKLMKKKIYLLKAVV